MITAKEYAEIHGVHYTTVMNWLRRELLPGAIKEELPFGGYFYKIPASAPIPELKPGPKPKSASVGEVQAESASTADDQAIAATDEPPAKPKRRASKRSSAKKASKTTRSRKAMKKSAKKGGAAR